MAPTRSASVTFYRMDDRQLASAAEQAREFVALMPTAALAAVVQGHLSLNDLAADMLAARGLDHGGKWVGFAAAAQARAAGYPDAKGGKA